MAYMTERPILFSAEMIRAILSGRKTKTRRVMKPQPEFYDGDKEWGWISSKAKSMLALVADKGTIHALSPYGVPGDQLWVRETWRCEELPDGLDGTRYRADDAFQAIKNTHDAASRWLEASRPNNPWRPSIFMPRWASRIQLEVISVRFEPVQDITAPEVRKEGVSCILRSETAFVQAFTKLWNSINDKRGHGWDRNPWVWVVEFKEISKCQRKHQKSSSPPSS
jgi:hypothetical protein